MNYDEFTLFDCIALYEFKGTEVIIQNGHITGLLETNERRRN
ncbi:MAG: hypothetical protein K0R92_553 [Lachnospiraceae bacterium]|jgi:hypothetical protein|nr:hypothetical protein [Lachnospiraceae bacterium]